jgi:uncharacterized delta-60 repeat protein
MRSNLKLFLTVLLVSIALASSASDDRGVQRHGRTRAGADKANDVATAMVVDEHGNSYTTGYSKGKGTGYDFLTIKYDSNGNEVWAERLDGGSQGDDKPVAVQLDSKGNVYVTGSSQGGPADSDYLTVKYDADGKLLWKQRYNGTANGFDSPAAMVVDASGKVYVTGFSLSKGSGYDCVTVAYSPDGGQMWASVYNGPESEDDFGTAIALDSSGNCFVTGYSKTKSEGASYLTIKFDSSGHGVWVRNFALGSAQVARATGVAPDGKGGVCVTGYAQGAHPSYDYVTIRYDAGGKALWSRRFDGAGHGDDKPAAIAVDSTGCYYVSGESEGAGASGADFLTLKYSPDGLLLWQARLDGASLTDSASAMSLDPKGGPVVTGKSVSPESGSDFLTVKYDRDGKQVWTARYNGEANGLDAPVAVALDSSGNVYVAGYSWGGKDSGFDYMTIKYAPDGKQVWAKRYNGPGSLQL